ncbi:hypothetical protein Pint_18233 [Pistacia integerrima]|uniref:Uncharacterized protein n=2 Tax=Pistacia TaxID=55512 RepID=A0ACC1C0M7_9ROSI|nr:hypothetical protein Pint_18233 [Pistacia integerrima]KAJ0105700.1 hypothetical protein Patl1_18216 [Pistacia atlantica]
MLEWWMLSTENSCEDTRKTIHLHNSLVLIIS